MFDQGSSCTTTTTTTTTTTITLQTLQTLEQDFLLTPCCVYALQRFIQHYERLTRRCQAELPGHVHYLLQLNEARHIVSCKNPTGGVML